MYRRIFLSLGWLFPIAVLLVFLIKGQHYNPAVFTPPKASNSALPLPSSVEGWVLEGGAVLAADRMYEKIDGKSDYYLQYGAVDLFSGEWIAGEQRWDMYLYHFKTVQGARGAYTGERPADGLPIEGSEGYALPGQAVLAAGSYYLQLNALEAGADPEPAIALARALLSLLDGATEEAPPKAEIDLTALAGADMAGDAEGFVPENAFGFSSLNQVRTVDVVLDGAKAVWFTTSGDDELVSAFAEELAMYGGEDLFSENGAAGGAMFGSWSIVGLLDGAIWGVHGTPSQELLQRHWNALQKRLKTISETP